MSELRLALLIIGLFIIGAVLVWGWLRSRPSYAGGAAPVRESELPPSGFFGDRGSPDEVELERMKFFGLKARREPVDASELEAAKVSPEFSDPLENAAAAKPPQIDPMIISVTVMPDEGERFRGPKLLEVFEGAGLYYGELQIFHAPVDLERTDGPTLFSVANIVEPGTLVPEQMANMQSPGLILFGRLPARVRGTEVLDHMVATAGYLAKTLGGHLCDSQRRLLTTEGAEQMRARVEQEIGECLEAPDDEF
jgi:cell division protein ZipA